MWNFLIMIVGYMFIYGACDYKRGPESQIKGFSKEWWIQVALVAIGGSILIASNSF